MTLDPPAHDGASGQRAGGNIPAGRSLPPDPALADPVDVAAAEHWALIRALVRVCLWLSMCVWLPLVGVFDWAAAAIGFADDAVADRAWLLRLLLASGAALLPALPLIAFGKGKVERALDSLYVVTVVAVVCLLALLAMGSWHPALALSSARVARLSHVSGKCNDLLMPSDE